MRKFRVVCAVSGPTSGPSSTKVVDSVKDGDDRVARWNETFVLYDALRSLAQHLSDTE